jgi:hypothetical protein
MMKPVKIRTAAVGFQSLYWQEPQRWNRGTLQPAVGQSWVNDQKKFGSQNSDNMDTWKAEVGRVREEKGRRK